MKTNKFTRLLAVLLSVLMVASSLPLVANAGDTQTGTISQSESVLVWGRRTVWHFCGAAAGGIAWL